MADRQKFSHHVAAEESFVDDGLRKYFQYKDLGISNASNGDVIAQIVKAKEGHHATGQWHWHECTFQMFYVLEGWARFEYEGEGVHVVKKGDCVLQPAKIRHREVEHSEDFEVLEIVSPADFKTHVVDDPPAETPSPADVEGAGD